MSATPEDAITDKELGALMEFELENIKQLFKEPQQDYVPRLLVALRSDYGQDLKLAVCMLADFPEDGKEKILQGLGTKFWDDRKENGTPVAVLFCSEGWQVKYAENSKEAKEVFAGKRKPSQSPYKTEALVVYGQSIDGRKCTAIHDLGRNAQGKIDKVKLHIYAPPTDPFNKKFQSGLVNNFYIGVAHAAGILERSK